MARNRQRAKQRQAERRARRLEQQERQEDQGDGAKARAAEGDGGAVADVEDPRAAEPAPGIDPSLAVGAPPQDEGRSGPVIEEEPALEDEEEEEHLEDYEIEEEAEAEAEEGYAPRGRRGDEEAEAKDRPRFIQFLIACWAELQRVQWPNRQALTTLTGVVLGFVLIAGGYLGLLDAIFSRLIQAIL